MGRFLGEGGDILETGNLELLGMLARLDNGEEI